MVDLKTCSKCGESKPLAGFHRNKANKDGLQKQCIGCHSVQRAKWSSANPDKYRTYVAKQTTRDTRRARRYARALKYFEGRPRWVSRITACLHREKRLSQMEWMVPSLADHLSTQEI